MKVLANGRRVLALLLCSLSLARGQEVSTADGLASFVVANAAAPGWVPIPEMNYLALEGDSPGTPLTTAAIQSGAIPNNGNYGLVFSANAPGQFVVWTNGPAFQTPIVVGSSVYYGTEASAIQLSNNVNYSTIEFSMPANNNLPYLAVSGFLKVPALPNTAATYDAIVLGASVHVSPYSTEDWTLQLNCGQTNYIQFEDANGTTGTSKLNPAPVPANRWLYFTMVMNTTNGVETGVVYDTSTWSVLTSCTRAMGLTNVFMDYWLFGNNEAGSSPGLCFYFSGLNWTNTPLPPPPPPYTSATNSLVAQYKFSGDLTDASPNANNGSEFGGTYSFATGETGAANSAISVAGATISSAATNPVSAITVNFWINNNGSGMPIAHQEFTSWYAYMDSTGVAQFDLLTSGGHLDVTTGDSWVGSWHMFTATWDSAGDGKVRIYRDGVLDATSSTAIAGTIVPAASNLTIGSGSSGYALTSAVLEDVRVYGRALNASEISAVYAAGADGNINL